MKNNIIVMSLMILLLNLILISTAQTSYAQKVTNPALRAKFVFCGSDLNCEAGNRVRQDSTNEYVDGIDGVSAVFNVGSGSQDLTINLITSRRSVWFDFSSVYKFYNNAGAYVVPSWYATPQNVKPHFNVLKAYNAKLTCPTPTPATGCNYRTAMNAGGWSVGGIEYAMQWNPESTFKAVVNEQGPTSYVNVHYQNDGSGDVYTITPIPNASGQPVAGLAKTVRKSTTNAGQYFLPFTLVVKPK